MYKINFMKWDAFRRGIHQTLVVMRLTIIITLIAILQLSAKDTVGQKLTYSKDNTTISEIFKEIKRQTGYNVVWQEGKLNSHMPIDVNFYKTPLEKVMDNILDGHSVTYEIIGKSIVVRAGAPSFRDKIISALAIDVRGRVVDDKNQPLQGATVKIREGTNSTVTNVNGEFSLQNVNAKDILVITFIGYDTKEISASEKLGNIQLIQSTDKLQEVEINAGYYTVKDRERTGSISRITSEDIDKQPVNNVLAAMQANLPGVQITQDTGVPGGGFTVQIRGKNSIQQGSNPLYIIDGVPFTSTPIVAARLVVVEVIDNPNPLASINPADIESIEVLKDADATAIYGSRGANGVILITTKKGKRGQAQTTISSSTGMSRVSRKLNLMNTTEYLSMRLEAFKNDLLEPSTTDYDVNGVWSSSRSTNWQKELIGGTAPNTTVSASVSGGSGNVTYLAGGTYYKEGTVFPGNNSYGRNSGNFSLDFLSNNRKFSFQFSANYSQVNSNLTARDLTLYIKLPPNYPTLRNENGSLHWDESSMGANPLAALQQELISKTSNLLSNGRLSYDLTSNLTLSSSFGYTIMNRNDYSNRPLSSYSPLYNFGSNERIAQFGKNEGNTWIVEPILNWKKKYGRDKVDFLLGATFQQNITEGETIQGSQYTSDALLGNIGAASLLSVLGRQYLQYRYTAFFTRLNYTAKGKYFFNATGRRDGSSRFGQENRFANFGAVGVSWLLSEENLIKRKLPFFSLIKLRGSYGVTGNDQLSDYGYLQLWRSNTLFSSTYQGTSTIAPDQLSNPEYAWEINKKAEAALEVSFFKNSINFSVGFYANRSSNLLIRRQLSPSTGFTSIQDNLPAKVGNTGWEFELNSKNINKKFITWTTSINLSIPKNKLLSYPNLETSSDAINYKIGHPLSILKTYNTFVDVQSGLFMTEDYNRNGVIDDNDRYLVQFIGRKFYGGVNNSISFKGINFDFLIQFVKQSGYSLESQLGDRPGMFNIYGPLSNLPIQSLKRWQKEGDVSQNQKYSTGYDGFSDYINAINWGNSAIRDASFIRLKNISISYLIPSKLFQKTPLKVARIYIHAQNLITFTNYKGLDPEVQSLSKLPALQTYVAGLQLIF